LFNSLFLVLWDFFETGSHYVVQAGHELSNPLPHSQSQDDRHVPPCMVVPNLHNDFSDVSFSFPIICLFLLIFNIETLVLFGYYFLWATTRGIKDRQW
jgi:hypothetical protein